MTQGSSSIQPTNPYHIARAYGLTPPARPAPSRPSQPAAAEQAGGAHQVSGATRLLSQERPGISRLVGGRVPGSVDFSSGEAMPQKGGMVIPFYRHPADQNAAATNIQIGRALDVSA